MNIYESLQKKRRRIFEIIQIGNIGDVPSRLFDIMFMVMVCLNLFIVIFETFDESLPYMPVLNILETITVIAFTGEYILRVWTADYLHPEVSRHKAMLRYALSFSGIIDLLSFLPFFLPVFTPSGAVVFRIFRVIRILRLFRVNAYSDALNVISDVVSSKKNQLISSVFIIIVLMTASSLCMYSLEHEAQPEVFKNAFSGFWWAVSALLTVGYGDIYPVTIAGKIFGIIITFLGVGMVAIPTGILSAGFLEQYTKLKEDADANLEKTDRYIRFRIEEGHPWADLPLKDLNLPAELKPEIVRRGDTLLVPKDELVIMVGDQIIIGGEGIHLEQLLK